MAIKDKENKLNDKETEKVVGGYENLLNYEIEVGDKLLFCTSNSIFWWSSDFSCFVEVIDVHSDGILYVVPLHSDDWKTLADAQAAGCALQRCNHNRRDCFSVDNGEGHQTFFYRREIK